MERLRNSLLHWYDANRRELPWRATRDPYFIWLSEVILQQTRISQGMPYYLRFVERFPTVTNLAMAPEQDVLKEWEGLGYYSRARNLHKAAGQILSEHAGEFPASYAELLKLKGIGPYTAAAIASIAFDEAVPLIDGNVARVLARLFCLNAHTGTSSFKKQAMEILNELIDPMSPGTFNQALMEFGALQCVPGKPDCMQCPLREHCHAWEKKQVGDYPVKGKTQQPRLRYFHYFFFRISIGDVEYTLVRKRKAKDIWQHLYEFPLIETPQPSDTSAIMHLLESSSIPLKAEPNQLLSITPMKHVLSHQTIHTSFYTLRTRLQSIQPLDEDYQMVQIKQLTDFPMSRMITRFMENHLIRSE